MRKIHCFINKVAMNTFLHPTFVSTSSSLGTSSEVPSTADMEEIIYGCSSTNAKKKLNEIKMKMLDYFRNIQGQCETVRKRMTIREGVVVPDIFAKWISDYGMLLDTVTKLVSDGIDKVETACASMLEKITTKLSENDTEWILSEFNRLMSWYDDIGKEITEKCRQLQDMDKNGKILLQKFNEEIGARDNVLELFSDAIFNKINAMFDEIERRDEIASAEREKKWQEYKRQDAKRRAEYEQKQQEYRRQDTKRRAEYERIRAERKRKDELFEAEWAKIAAELGFDDMSDSIDTSLLDDFDWSVFDD